MVTKTVTYIFQYFSYIVAVSFIGGGETGVPGENTDFS
jgi:hypothetical protein